MSFFDTYFIQPILADEGYNFVNSIVYALIAIGALYAVYKLVEKLKIKIDIKFFYAVLPFIILGSTIRAFVDHEVLDYNFWSVSPGIYLAIAALFIFNLVMAFVVEKKAKIPYWKTCASFGVGALISMFVVYSSKLGLTNLRFFAMIIIIFSLISLGFWTLSKKVWWLRGTNLIPIPAHMLDATTTFIAVDFLGFTEKHPLPVLATKLFGSAAIMYILKLTVILPAIYLISKEIKNENLRNFMFISIATLGLAEGLRNLLTIILV